MEKKKTIRKNKNKNKSNKPNVDFKRLEIHEIKHEARFVSDDNKEVFFVIAGKEPEFDSGVWINSPYFVSAFNTLFERNAM